MGWNIINHLYLQQTVASAVAPSAKENWRPQILPEIVLIPKAAGVTIAALAADMAPGI